MLGQPNLGGYDLDMFLSNPCECIAAPDTSDVLSGAAIFDFVSVDVETACSRVSSICQIGIVGFRGGEVVFEFETLIDPRDHFSSFNSRIHGITADHIVGKPSFGDLHPEIAAHLGSRITVAHSYFDKGALAAACRMHDRAAIEARWLDSVRVAKRAWPELSSHRLNVVSRHLGIQLKHHDALSDARAAGLIVIRASQETGIPVDGWITGGGAPPLPTPGDTPRRGDPDRQGRDPGGTALAARPGGAR